MLRAISGLTALTSLDVSKCENVTDEGLSAVSGLTALTVLDIQYCDSVTAEGKQALRDALPRLQIRGPEL